jgi:hypothetical protein
MGNITNTCSGILPSEKKNTEITFETTDRNKNAEEIIMEHRRNIKQVEN